MIATVLIAVNRPQSPEKQTIDLGEKETVSTEKREVSMKIE
jgi:hypothetical protein